MPHVDKDFDSHSREDLAWDFRGTFLRISAMAFLIFGATRRK